MTTTAGAELDRAIGAELDGLREAGTYKRFNTLVSPQGAVVEMDGRGEVIVLSSNNYLGLAARPEVVEAGIEGLRRYGAGTGSVRFICGTFEPHLELERELADFVGTEAALTYVSCWNANEAAIPTLVDDSTVILSDELNHASIIDAIRLSRPARKVIYAALRHGRAASGARVVRAGPAQARRSPTACSRWRATSRGCPRSSSSRARTTRSSSSTTRTGPACWAGRAAASPSTSALLGEIDVITSTLGKALGGAAGGFVAASEEVCDLLAQRSRPQLFSNALPPTVACSRARGGARAAARARARVEAPRQLSQTFRTRLREIGYAPLDGEAAIIPIIVGETAFAIRMSERLLDEGVFVTGFGFPVVPEGAARIRVQMSAALDDAQLERALEAFARVGSSSA